MTAVAFVVKNKLIENKQIQNGTVSKFLTPLQTVCQRSVVQATWKLDPIMNHIFEMSDLQKSDFVW